jgi:hypothetical protein
MPLGGVNDPGLPRPKLILQVEGARERELARGVAAAEAVLYRDGDIDLVAAMPANANRDFIMFDGDGQPINDITEEQHRLATLWEDAAGGVARSVLRRLGRTVCKGFLAWHRYGRRHTPALECAAADCGVRNQGRIARARRQIAKIKLAVTKGLLPRLPSVRSPARHVLRQQCGHVRIRAASENLLFLIHLFLIHGFVARAVLPDGARAPAGSWFLIVIWFGHHRAPFGKRREG